MVIGAEEVQRAHALVTGVAAEKSPGRRPGAIMTR